MKKYINSFLLIMIAVTMLQSCEESDKTVDFVLDGVTRGATLKTMEIKNGVVDINNLATSNFEVELEYRDHKDGTLMQSFDVYARFIDNTEDGVDNSTEEAFLFNQLADTFEIDPEYGFPRGDLNVNAGEAFTVLGLTDEKVNGGDVIVYRLVLKLSDGRTFTDNASGNVTGGSFFSSPFAYAVPLVCLFDQPDFFSGTYLMEQIAGTDPFFGDQTFGTATVNIAASGIARSFTFLYYPGYFDIEDTCTFNLVCGDILVSGKAGTLGCGSTIGYSTGSTASKFDENLIDDDVIEVNITDFLPDGDCETGPNQIVVRFTKQ